MAAAKNLDKSFDPHAIEAKWYAKWEASGVFEPSGQGEPYCIMLPPPNVTGSLHMGHAFQDTIMDALTRYHRMSGHNTLWQCGMDHAGIATQMVVERQLAAQGTSRHDLGREGFVDAVWEWKEKSGGRITEQMKKLGASVDWNTERFTMDPGLSEAVAKVFVDLYREDLIYRGKRLVNWDPVLHTALSDLEVLSAEEQGHLWHLRYPRTDGNGYLVVATTRPETMLGDTAVAVHPDDERYQDLIGQTLELPLTNRQIPVIADEYVDPEFGTGCVKITPAHDFNDYEIGRRHRLEMINVLTPDASMNDAVPAPYQGLDRFEARARVVSDLEALDLLEGIDDHKLMVPRGDRSGAVLEPLLTDQWYVKAGPLAEPAIEAVRTGKIEFVPANWDKTYYEWMLNIQDWCISRQLWWGHRIPAWYDDQGNVYVGHNELEARAHYGLADELALHQDEDVLDTWFSSALWPFSTIGWPEQTQRLQTFYPTSVLVTGFDIIFFWVARMIMMGLKFMGDVPFRTVYIHGLIRDSQGQKMSKSKGNVLDPLDLIEGIDLDTLIAKRTTGLMQPQMAPAIEKATRRDFGDGIKPYGTDALRMTFAALATTGRDIRFDLGRIEGYRNFCNKLWNAARFVLMNCEDATVSTGQPARNAADQWIRSALVTCIEDVTRHIEGYRFDLAVQSLYEFTWNEYCDWYLELAKVQLRSTDAETAEATRATLLEVLEALLRLLHPITPFISEEIWQQVRSKLNLSGDSISLRPFPLAADFSRDTAAEADIAWLKALIVSVRQVRAEMDVAPRKSVAIFVAGGSAEDSKRSERLSAYLDKVGFIQEVTWLAEGQDEPAGSAVALAGQLKVMVPMGGLVDLDAERQRLGRELEKREQDHKKISAKLANPKFVQNAPEAVVQTQADRLAQVEAEITALKDQLARIDEV